MSKFAFLFAYVLSESWGNCIANVFVVLELDATVAKNISVLFRKSDKDCMSAPSSSSLNWSVSWLSLPLPSRDIVQGLLGSLFWIIALKNYSIEVKESSELKLLRRSELEEK